MAMRFCCASLNKFRRIQPFFTTKRLASKVPLKPVNDTFSIERTELAETIELDAKLLESLSLVDVENERMLDVLKSSIQFANKIASIEGVDDVAPLYTVLEEESLYLRADEATDTTSREEILSNAKVVEEDYFVSPPGNIPLHQ